jgi:hypothetical protein
MSAVEDGDDLVCNGYKLWTAHAVKSVADKIRAGTGLSDDGGALRELR